MYPLYMYFIFIPYSTCIPSTCNSSIRALPSHNILCAYPLPLSSPTIITHYPLTLSSHTILLHYPLRLSSETIP